MHISPQKRACGQALASQRKASMSLGATPLLLGSSAMLTSSSTFVAFVVRASISCTTLMLLTEWISVTIGTTSRVLRLCRWPMK